MSSIALTRGVSVSVDATIPAGKRGQVRLSIYSPKNKRLTATVGKTETYNGDGSVSVVMTFTPPDIWFTGNVCSAFLDCGQCGYGTGKYVVELIEATSSNLFTSELTEGSVTVDAPAPSQGLLEELCPDCADSNETPGDPPTDTDPGDPLMPNPPAPAGEICLPPDFVNPTPTVPTPCDP